MRRERDRKTTDSRLGYIVYEIPLLCSVLPVLSAPSVYYFDIIMQPSSVA